MLRLAERLTFQSSHAAIVTNESCKEIAITRGGVPPERCFVVRNCPGLNDFPPRAVNHELKRGKRYLVIYVGVMGSQDGVGLLIDSAAYVTKTRGRTDVVFVLIGDGTEARKMRARASERGLGECVQFTGSLYGDDLKAYLAAADIGVAPDPSNLFNDKLTMIKILEYMASGLPVVLFDLPEGRSSADSAALYARPNDPSDFGEKILSLLDSDALRRRLGIPHRTWGARPFARDPRCASAALGQRADGGHIRAQAAEGIHDARGAAVTVRGRVKLRPSGVARPR